MRMHITGHLSIDGPEYRPHLSDTGVASQHDFAVLGCHLVGLIDGSAEVVCQLSLGLGGVRLVTLAVSDGTHRHQQAEQNQQQIGATHCARPRT
ncbi:MAG: hypothetical protein IPG66_05795 [Hydrogenophilales bacterium]|nr:hypothetical protein [Hydrogenophilales bacterium]